jgi:hypothetical protein
MCKRPREAAEPNTPLLVPKIIYLHHRLLSPFLDNFRVTDNPLTVGFSLDGLYSSWNAK